MKEMEYRYERNKKKERMVDKCIDREKDQPTREKKSVYVMQNEKDDERKKRSLVYNKIMDGR